MAVDPPRFEARRSSQADAGPADVLCVGGGAAKDEPFLRAREAGLDPLDAVQ